MKLNLGSRNNIERNWMVYGCMVYFKKIFLGQVRFWSNSTGFA